MIKRLAGLCHSRQMKVAMIAPMQYQNSLHVKGERSCTPPAYVNMST